MKRLFFPDKGYSWLQFPVALKGYPPERHPHLTVKFFGNAEIDHYAIEKRVGTITINEREVKDMKWQPTFWSSPVMHSNHYVLALTAYPPILSLLHNMFDFLKDQYIPWTPHITVTKEYFLMVEDQGFTPQECRLEFGEIELCLGGNNI